MEMDGNATTRLNNICRRTLSLQNAKAPQDTIALFSNLASVPEIAMTMHMAGIPLTILEKFGLGSIPANHTMFNAASLVWCCIMACSSQEEVERVYSGTPVAGLVCHALEASIHLGTVFFDQVTVVMNSILGDQTPTWKYQTFDIGCIQRCIYSLDEMGDNERAEFLRDVLRKTSDGIQQQQQVQSGEIPMVPTGLDQPHSLDF